jgi:hypothetical protein
MTDLEQRVAFLEATAIANLKDFFATSALSILSNPHTVKLSADTIAGVAYDIAESMIAERKKRNSIKQGD